MLVQARLSIDEMHTVESILNSIPLTYTSSTDIEEPLTPSHLEIAKVYRMI